jgi:hypothetical protein
VGRVLAAEDPERASKVRFFGSAAIRASTEAVGMILTLVNLP